MKPCRCKIPARDRGASILNEAYTVISEAFEPGRRSYTGHVLKSAVYEAGDHLQPPDTRSQHIEATSNKNDESDP